VISGYVVSASLLRRKAKDAKTFFTRFYARRAKRLLPALFFMILVVATVAVMFIPPSIGYKSVLHSTLNAAILGCVGFANMFFWLKSALSGDGGYFAAEAAKEIDYQYNPFLHLWSLGVEEQFYVIFTLMAFFSYGEHMIETGKKRSSNVGLWVSCFLIALSLICSGVFYALSSNRFLKEGLFYLITCRWWEMAAGALLLHCRVYFENWDSIIDRWYVVHSLEILATGLLAAGFVVNWNTLGFPFPTALLPVFGTIFYIMAGSSPKAYTNRFMSLKVFTYVGKISYALYLWHWPVLVFAKWASSVEVMQQGWVLFVLFLISFVMAMISYHLIEEPVRKWRPKQMRKVAYVFVPLAAILILWLALLWGPLYGDLYVYSKPEFNEIIYEQIIYEQCACHKSDTFHHPPGASSDASLPKCMYPSGMNIKPSRAVIPASNCLFGSWGGERDSPKEDIKNCLDKNRAANRRFLAIGDSHIQELIAGIDTLPNVKLSHAIHYACTLQHNWGQSCSDFTHMLKEVLPEILRSTDVVLMSTWHYSVNHDSKQNDPEAYYKKFEDMNKSWKEILDIVKTAGASLVLFQDHPNMVELFGWSEAYNTGSMCYDTPWRVAEERFSCLFPKPDISKEYEVLLAGLEGDHFHFFESYDLFCDDAQCGAFIPGTSEISIVDRDHLSLSASLYVAPFLCTFLNERGLLPTKDER
jgi:peptidoglycan/LPS O-acetylase OafA/YrhL